MAKKKEVEITDVVIFDTETEIGEPEPNVAFAGREWRTDENTGKPKLAPSRFAPEGGNNAKGHFSLPPSEVQTSAGAAGFWSEHADYLKQHFKDPNGKVAGVFYKEPTKKGV